MRGESRGRDMRDGREGGRQGRRHPRKMKNTRVHKEKKRDGVKERSSTTGEGYGCIRDGITREKTGLEG